MDMTEKLSQLPKMWSTWVSFMGALLLAAPIDWTTFDWTALTLNKVIAGAVWFIVWCGARVKSQPSVTGPTP